MNIAIGVEGGGTSTRILIGRDNEAPEYIEQKLSIKVVRGDYEESARRLNSLIANALGDLVHVSSIVIGLAGLGDIEHQDLLTAALRTIPKFEDATIIVKGDAQLTLEAAFADEDEGILAIGGTGSVVFVKLENEVIRLGGWGPILSDEGSGYWIGVRALQWYISGYDERTDHDELYDAVKKQLPKSLAENPIMLAHKVEHEPQYAAAFAKAVFETSLESSVANEILQTASVMFSGLIRSGLERLSPDAPRIVALAGSIAKHKYFLEHLSHSMFDMGVDLRLVDDMSPVQHALRLAVEQLDEKTAE